MKVAVVSTHPIQYQTPWYQKLAAQKQIELTVYYAMMPDREQQGVGFDVPFAWDIPLLEGYAWELLPNRRKSPSLRGFFASSTPAIYSILKKTRPDVVIITGWQSLPLLEALWASMRLGIPRIVRGESNSLRKRPMLVRMWHRALLSRFNAFLAIGQANREFYLEYGTPAERVFQANYFVDNRRFEDQCERDRPDRASLRKGWQIPEGHTCFLYAGKLEPKKRLMDLLQALDATQRSSHGIHLLVVGTGELMEEARAFASARELPVTFVGFLNQTEITRAYVAADCLVLPSDYGETWGLVVNEAMVCGLPAIASDRVGCAADLVREGITGGVFACGDVGALAGKLAEFAGDRETLLRMGERARQLIKDYSVDQAVAGTLRAIEYVVNKNARVQSTTPASLQ
ncbi:MAG: glycosyltransferase family 4 protein [Acidobacteriota bacterium]